MIIINECHWFPNLLMQKGRLVELRNELFSKIGCELHASYTMIHIQKEGCRSLSLLSGASCTTTLDTRPLEYDSISKTVRMKLSVHSQSPNPLYSHSLRSQLWLRLQTQFGNNCDLNRIFVLICFHPFSACIEWSKPNNKIVVNYRVKQYLINVQIAKKQMSE